MSGHLAAITHTSTDALMQEELSCLLGHELPRLCLRMDGSESIEAPHLVLGREFMEPHV